MASALPVDSLPRLLGMVKDAVPGLAASLAAVDGQAVDLSARLDFNFMVDGHPHQMTTQVVSPREGVVHVTISSRWENVAIFGDAATQLREILLGAYGAGNVRIVVNQGNSLVFVVETAALVAN